jgi:hypothetical protein
VVCQVGTPALCLHCLPLACSHATTLKYSPEQHG